MQSVHKLGNLIVLNGTSSSGKTTLAKALQRIMDDPYLHLGNDQFLHPHAPDHLIRVQQRGDEAVPVDGWLATFDHGRFVDLQVGTLGLRWIHGMYAAFAAWTEHGNHLIADVVMHDDRIVRAAAETFHALPAWLISVYCPLEAAEQREQERTERRASGGARVFYDAVYGQSIYDLRVDTFINTPEVCAEQIKRHIQSSPPKAFRQLQRQFTGAP